MTLKSIGHLSTNSSETYAHSSKGESAIDFYSNRELHCFIIDFFLDTVAHTSSFQSQFYFLTKTFKTRVILTGEISC